MRAYLTPHVPFILPELGGTQLEPFIQEILSSFNSIREDLENDPPEAILICSPHFQGTTFEIGTATSYRGDLSNFKRSDIVETRSGHLQLSKHLQKQAEDIGFVTHKELKEQGTLDYGSIVPLRLIDPERKIPVIPISISLGSKKEHYLWGKYLYELACDFSDNIVFLASTELTQDFNEDPRAYPINTDEDVRFMEYITTNEQEKMVQMPKSYFKKVENDLLPTYVLTGFGSQLTGEIITYSGLVGCGCAFIKFT